MRRVCTQTRQWSPIILPKTWRHENLRPSLANQRLARRRRLASRLSVTRDCSDGFSALSNPRLLLLLLLCGRRVYPQASADLLRGAGGAPKTRRISSKNKEQHCLQYASFLQNPRLENLGVVRFLLRFSQSCYARRGGKRRLPAPSGGATRTRRPAAV